MSLEPPLEPFSLARRLFAEGLGTAMLLAIVIGSGVMGERLAGGNTAIALLGNTIATGPCEIVGADCAAVSFPNFFQLLESVTQK